MATETWMYGGVRVLEKKRVHAWIDEAGKERLYKDIGFRAIGGYYTVEVTRTDGSVKRGEPEYTGELTEDAELRQRLSAADHVARVRLERLSRERSAIKQNDLDEALEPLLKIARSLNSQYARDAFAAMVLRKITSSW